MNLRQLLPLGPLKVSTCLPLGSNANTRQRVAPESDTVKGHRHTLHLAEAWACPAAFRTEREFPG